MNTAIYTILGTILFLWAFWYLYVLVMGIYRAYLKKRLGPFTYFLAFPAVAIGFIVDVVAQYTIACLFFLDLPRRGEHLVTTRLQRYVAEGDGWRAVKAEWICTHLLDVFDPSGDHC